MKVVGYRSVNLFTTALFQTFKKAIVVLADLNEFPSVFQNVQTSENILKPPLWNQCSKFNGH